MGTVRRQRQDYVALAEAASGPIPQPVDYSWPWGDAMQVLDELAPDLRIVNLETSITTSEDAQPAKAVLYRMHPGNVGCLTVARLDACSLANNHVLDFGVGGLEETLDVLTRRGFGTGRRGTRRAAGVAPGRAHRRRPSGPDLVGGVGLERRAARLGGGPDRSPESPSSASSPHADAFCERVRRVKQPGDIAVVSVHWGSNWGYDVPRAQVRFAHRLIDSGVDVVHGHSSHHPRPVEVYRDRLVLYGCGDLINDYEGIGGQERFRGDLRLLYVARLDPAGALDELRMVPLHSRKMRLQLATDAGREVAASGPAQDQQSLRIAGRPRARRQPAADEVLIDPSVARPEPAGASATQNSLPPPGPRGRTRSDRTLHVRLP